MARTKLKELEAKIQRCDRIIWTVCVLALLVQATTAFVFIRMFE